ncbi:MAG: cupin domain-containing protein [Chloroflexi bacterium]|nr:cupin domain-containing protein [Chloroflexota bacterium]
MAFPGQVLENPVTGVRVVFVETPRTNGGLRLIHEFTFPVGMGREYPHVHQESRDIWEILEGTATYQLGGKTVVASAGDRVEFPPGVPHLHPYNTGTGPLRVRQTVEFPTPHPEELEKIDAVVETFFGLARDGKVGPDGVPGFMQVMVSFGDLLPELAMPGIPLPVQRVMMGGLAAIARVRGIQPTYPEYTTRQAA